MLLVCLCSMCGTCGAGVLQNPLQSFASRRDLVSLCDSAEEEQGPTTPLPEDPQVKRVEERGLLKLSCMLTEKCTLH